MGEKLSYSALMPPMCLLIAAPMTRVIIAFWWRRTGLAIGADLIAVALCLLHAIRLRTPAGALVESKCRRRAHPP